jgi:hypothetical protein
VINSNIFNKINTKSKAYWLGFIAADGYVEAKGNRISFMLSVKDEIQLDKFIIFVGGDKKQKKYYTGDFNSKKVFYSLSNNKISKNLKKQGIVSPKGKNLKLPRFNKESLNLAFICGFYDGDGHEHSPTLCCGSKKFLLSIKQKYKIKSKISYKKNHLGSCYYLYLGVDFVRNLMKNYKDSMIRKKKF